MSIRYEIEKDTNAVRVFYDDSDVPSLYQPHYPGGDSWVDAADAESWAKLYVASVTDPAAPYPPSNIGQPAKPKPTPEEIAAMKAKMEELRNSPKQPAIPPVK